MRLMVKTLKGSCFLILVQPSDSIIAVKKSIEEIQGKESYPWGQQLLIHNGKVLKDESTLDENNVNEDGFLVVMLSKSKSSATSGPSSAQPPATASASHPSPTVATSQAPSSNPPPTVAVPEAPSSHPSPIVTPPQAPAPANAYDEAASNLVVDSNREQTVQQLMDMGGGNWDRDTVLRALRAAYNNPERAVDYLYSGIPEAAEVAIPVAHFPTNQSSDQGVNTTEAAVGAESVSRPPNSSPFNMFPQGIPSIGAGAGGGTLDFLRNNEQFLALRSMVQSNPHILQPMLQELSKQNPQLLRLIQEHHAEFLQLINEPVEDFEGDLLEQPEQESISVTPVEQEAIARLEAMGFDRALVIEAFFACDRNEELAANYLLEHAGDDD